MKRGDIEKDAEEKGTVRPGGGGVEEEEEMKRKGRNEDISKVMSVNCKNHS